MNSPYKTHNISDLTASTYSDAINDTDPTYKVAGWVHKVRDLGNIVFIDLRDRYGKTQIVFGPESGLVDAGSALRNEDVIKVVGKVAHRPEGTVNEKLPTGEVELRVTELQVFNKSETPPFTPSQQELPGEDLRLKYRYLDLRRKEMQETLILRSSIIKMMRDYLSLIHI